MALSSRGSAAAHQPLRADLELFYAALENKFHAQDNPEGAFTLCIAENVLNWPLMEAKLREVAAGPIPDWVPSYTSILGAPPLREAVAGLLHRFFANADFDPEKVAIAAGAAAVIEMTALLLGNPGDVVVIPGPAYMAYTPDLGNKADLVRYDLHPATTTNGTYYQLTIADLDRAYAELGDKFRMLLFTQPNNPTGQIYTEDQLAAFSDWCIARNIHLVVNEIYALSLLDQDHPDLMDDYGSRSWFTSILPLLEQKKSPYLHWWYAISKDFGLSGLRVGMAYSHNEALLQAWGNYGAPSMASNHTQWLLAEIFTDLAWVEAYVSQNAQLISKSYARVVRALRKYEVDYARAAGSLFVWFDLSPWLTADTEAAELELWQRIYDETGILLTSPLGQGSDRRGWFRLVYSCIPYAELEVAMERLEGFLARV